LDRLTHHVHILEMNGDGFRLQQSKKAAGALCWLAPTGFAPWLWVGFHCALSRPDGRPRAAFQSGTTTPSRNLGLCKVVHFFGALDTWRPDA
jgi:hypothetical protein